MRVLRVAIAIALILAVAFSAYIATLYRQLDYAFKNQAEYIPTRIYSDALPITPSTSRGVIKRRLEALGYRWDEFEDQIQFVLHTGNYPTTLLPEYHVTTELFGKKITLFFEGPDDPNPLTSIRARETEISEIYLEPELIATLSSSQISGAQVREPLKFENIPAEMWQAVISVEDQHFLEHQGFDIRGLGRAVWINLKTRSLAQGGSTITQQLVKNLTVRRGKNIFKKFSELFLAIVLEARYDKERILERYLNEVYLGQIGNLEIHGVAEGAKYFFNKQIEDLNLGEIALLAGLIRGPGYYSPYRHLDRAVSRQKVVLQKMVETGQIAPEKSENALAMPIRLSPPPSAGNKAPFFTDYVKAELIEQLADKYTEQEVSDSGFRVYTTIDPLLNDYAQSAVQNGITQVESRLKKKAEDRLEGALVAVDQSTGFVRSLIGGKNYSESTFNRVLNSRRQIGSTFKPIVYLSALRKKTDPNGIAYGPGYPLEDRPVTIHYDQGRGEWSPKNYDEKYFDWVNTRFALSHSLNAATARLGMKVGLKTILETATLLGFPEDRLPKLPAIILGTVELSAMELVNAYTILANGGFHDQLTVIRNITENNGKNIAQFIYQPKVVIDIALSDMMTELLQQAFIDGTAASAKRMGFDRPAAGKTGTTSDYRDSWFAGYTTHLTTVVWVGVDKGTPSIKLTGSSAALPIWVEFMKKAHKDIPPDPFPMSEYLSSVQIDKYTGWLSRYGCSDDQNLVERYMADNEPSDSSCADDWPASEPEITVDLNQ